MIKPLTIDNLSPTLRHLRWKMNYSDNSYRVFPPKWGWFTRAHYLLLRKFRSRSLNYLQMTWFPLQWVKQNIRRFDLVNSILPNLYFLEIALNTNAARYWTAMLVVESMLRDEVLRLYRVTHVTFSIVYQAQLLLMSSWQVSWAPMRHFNKPWTSKLEKR